MNFNETACKTNEIHKKVMKKENQENHMKTNEKLAKPMDIIEIEAENRFKGLGA